MRRWVVGLISCTLLVFFAVAPVVAAPGWQPLKETIRKSSQDLRQYQAIRLANDMTVLLVSDPQAVKSLSAIAVPVGSLENPDNQLGLAHYLEHMILMGSTHYPQPGNLDEFLKKHGGDHNASTASYRTAFYLEVENDALLPAIDRLADAIASPLLDPGYADKERHAVNAELTMARANDSLRMAQIRAETINPAHPGARFSGGNLDTLRDKPGSNLHQALTAFYHRYYSANLMVAVIYSNQPLPRLAQIAAQTYGRVANHNASVPDITVPVVTRKQTGILIHYQPVQPQKTLRVEFPIANNSKAFRSKTDTYISYLISNRSTNTLADWLQKQGLADAIDAGADPMIDRNGGVFAIAVSLSDKGFRQRDEVVAAIFSYLKELREKGIQQQYFDEIAHVLDQDFRYPVITRNMDYIEWLVDAMLRVPVAHVLDASYLADRYDPQAIAARLDSMTPENARVWFVSPDEPHDKTAYFVNAPYQVEAITPERLALWQRTQGQIDLSLPALNPYIANDFSLIKPQSALTHPQLIIDEPGLRLRYMPSRYFADEPRADITLNFRNPTIMSNARDQVLYAMIDYIAGQDLAELSNQAYVGGISFSSYENDGLTIKATGYTQRLTPLVLSLVNRYVSFTPTADQLTQAKSWYLEQLNGTEKEKPYAQAMIPSKVLSTLPYVERDTRRAVINDIRLQDLIDYRNNMFRSASLDMLVVGNLTAPQATALAAELKKQIGWMGTGWPRSSQVQIRQAQRAIIQKIGGSTDSALAAVYVPTGYDRVQGTAYSYLLSQIIESWFYQQLRTREQLGYAIFSLPVCVGEQGGIGFVLQSGTRQPAYLYQRYQAFFDQVEPRLRALPPADFEQYKQGIISQLLQQPQTLGAEVDRYTDEIEHDNPQFDTRDKLIAQLHQITLPQLADFFHQAVIEPNGLALLSQIGVKGHDQTQYAAPSGWVIYPNASALQKTLPELTHQ
ncbi:pitrilysin [Acerihabitans sp. TG2]|uniref:pitrilysin n=1 Tax=Acerihabitans sp. TG2 TaxID=3096008 RepID=UPI002B23398B|nr:pitrilysin [Acerihabitans sp. TG2]MEA9392509.1 pitrilysin [Acerihabitans sp. TG2]